MIAETGLLPGLTGDAAQYGAGETLIETYLRLAADLAWRLVQMGLSKRYIMQDVQSPFIRGQWLVARQMARSPMRVDRHELRIAELTPDTTLNRVLKCGLRLMARLATQAPTAARMHAVVQMMERVADITSVEAVGRAVSFDRLTASWQPLYQIIRQFLDKLLPTLEAGDQTRGLAWLFDMNELFEAFVARRLTQTLRPVRVQAQGPARNLARHTVSNQPLFLQRPDLVIGPAQRPFAIADTKWKRLGTDWAKNVSSDDIRQVFTYGRLYGAVEVLLIYPAVQGTARVERLVTADTAGMNISIAEIPIRRRDMMELNAHLRQLISLGVAPT
jgi:5-methylcytosine-specific restriction enzyme subunit McrC